jgi:NAD(P)-dependent dehydrogenase (short-subunit alcohol dehydrogenase family)
MSYSNKVVVITGAGSGIGRALAVGFAEDGASVVGFGRRRDALEATAEQCDGGMLVVAGDVTSQTDVDHLVTASMDRFGKIDVLVNNAGISGLGTLLDNNFEDWARVIDINLTGLALCTHRILPGMLKRRSGRIINVTSRSAESAREETSAYSASKAGVVTFTKAIAREIDRESYPDILINAMIPGRTISEMTPNTTVAAGWREAKVVYPHTRYIADLPSGGPTGRVFFDSEDYSIYVRAFNKP